MTFKGEYSITEEELNHYHEPGELYPREENIIETVRRGFYDKEAGVDRASFLPLKSKKTAFLVVDLQNDMVRPDAFNFCPDAHRMIPRVKAVLQRCRAVGVRPVYIKHCHDPRVGGKYWDLGHRKWLPRFVDYVMERGHGICGTEGTEIFPAIAPLPNEKVVHKHRWDGFVGTDLDVTLRGMDADTLIFSGAFAEACVESTARHAAELGYKVIYVSDLTASQLPEQHAAAIGRMRRLVGLVMTSDEILTELASLPLAKTDERS